MKRSISRAFLIATALAASTAARADDTLKLAVGQRGNWDTSVSEAVSYTHLTLPTIYSV